MPTITGISSAYRFYFFSSEMWDNRLEPPHVHVESADARAKFWLEGIELVKNDGFSAKELREITAIIQQHHERILEAWNEHFS